MGQYETTRVRQPHFPPLDASLLLHRTRKGRIKSFDKLPMPTNEYGVPDADSILEASLETLSSEYIIPTTSNVHHLVYPRRRYHDHPSGLSTPAQYRESASLMRRISIPIHNYWHEVFEDPVEPPMDVMYQWVKEQSRVDQLYYFGKTAIQLARSKYDEVSNIEIIEHRLKFQNVQDSLLLKSLFYDFLDSYDDSQLGLLPDREWLATIPFEKATRELGVLAGARALDIRRDSHKKIKEIGFSEEM
ncbi:hypothetical protein HY312_00250 [Candidatus Saccharibacteria bacterium]|nr:hypothetical protein [Candidatus Saccharibacteria bacterium]